MTPRTETALTKLKSGEGDLSKLDRMIVQSRVDTLEAAVHFLRVSLQPFAEGHVCPTTLKRARIAYDKTAPEALR